MHLFVEEKRIIWPGGMRKKPEGFMIPTHLKVLTIEEKPFVYTRKLLEITEMCGADEILCPHFNATDDGIKYFSFPSPISLVNYILQLQPTTAVKDTASIY